jgi:hypothetical protein
MKEFNIFFLSFILLQLLYSQEPDAISKAWSKSVIIEIFNADSELLGRGSGFLVGGNDKIATNFHVIDVAGAAYATAKFPVDEKTYYIRTVLNTDEFHDLAILQIESSYEPLVFAEKDDVEIGQEIFSIGSPKGLSGTVSDGIVSSIREIQGFQHLQITTPISPGSSGGPVINKKGEVIGIVVGAIQSGQNLNFAIPSHHLEALLEKEQKPTPFGRIIYVHNDGDKRKDLFNEVFPETAGKDWTSSYSYLADALRIAKKGDEIWVAEGIYKPDEGIGRTKGKRINTFYLIDGVSIYGGFLGIESVRHPQGDNNKTVLSGEIDQNSSLWSETILIGDQIGPMTIIDGLRISYSNANSDGYWGDLGGMILRKSSNLVRNVIFSHNKASGVSALSVLDCNTTFENCLFYKNNSGGSGVVEIWDNIVKDSHPLFKNCVFDGNSADVTGGALLVDKGASVGLYSCKFVNNISWGGGGALVSYGSSLLASRCIFNYNLAGNPGSISGIGGAAYIKENSRSTFLNCVFHANKALNSSSKGGAIYASNSIMTVVGSVFSENSAKKMGGAIANDSTSPHLINCTFNGNMAEEGGAIHNREGSNTTIDNSIFWGNKATSNYNQLDDNWTTNISFSNIVEGLQNDDRAKSLDPKFVDPKNPLGPDGKWFTNDDGFILKTFSPAIDTGDVSSIPNDVFDLDNDKNLDEIVPFDILRQPRLVGGSVDLGAYEYNREFHESNQVEVFAVNILTTEGGTVSGGGLFQKESDATLTAVANNGYVFMSWSGDLKGDAITQILTVDEDKNITANFSKDFNDNDGDGLTNYEELIKHGTNPQNQDSDEDGILDGKEIEIGSSPNFSDAIVFNYGKTLGIAEGKVSGELIGQTAVTSSPSAYNLVTQDAYDQMVQDMIASQNANATHYTEGWFYLPSRGWMWTNRDAYPYFYDSEDNDWMYFQSGEEKPKFYRYKTKTWLTIE